jgi:glycerol-3-phosphate acyltransferase PlsY|uniref:Phosphatidate cytidylyltransferase n=1 Tax=candidate division WOR-3 bacterium TaxID=2052148 RepID=A0A7V3PTP5_UNCW3
MAAATTIFLVVDLLRLRLNPFKDIFIILFGSLLRRKEFSSLTGGSYLMVAALVCMIIFGSNKGVFIAAISYLAVGDTLAAIVGLSVGKIRIFRKTLEGTIAGLLACIALAYLISILPNIDMPFLIGIIGAIAAAVVEALPFEINDNVAIPMFSGAIMMITLQLFH